MGGKHWIKDEIDILIKNKDNIIKSYLHLLPGRTEDTISAKRVTMGLIDKEKSKELNAICGFCGKRFHEFPSRLNGRVRFCSRECWINWQREQMEGENNHFYGKQHPPEIMQKIIEANTGKPNQNRKWTDNKLLILKSYLLNSLSYYEIAKLYNTTKSKIVATVNRYNLKEFYIAKYKHNSEGHLKLREILLELFPDSIFKNEMYIKKIRQYIDIVDLTNNIYYEYDGIQHYVQKNTWNREDKDFQLQQERDRRKINYCKLNNIPLIVIKYDEELNKELIVKKLKEQGINYEDICEKQVSSF